jgi:hypothetical protein
MVDLIKAGAWSATTQLSFVSGLKGGSHVNENGESFIHAVPIDELLMGKPATIIKMDIEGAEQKALMGAKELIKKYKPKLAVSVYHNPVDIIQIPVIIYDMSSGYRFFMRHHDPTQCETVLYAVHS